MQIININFKAFCLKSIFASLAILSASANASIIANNVATYTHSYSETYSNYSDLSCDNPNGCFDIKHSKNMTGDQSWILDPMKKEQYFLTPSDAPTGYQSLTNTNLAYIDSLDWDDAYGSIISAQANKDQNGLHYTSVQSGSYSAGTSTFGLVESYMLYQWRVDSQEGYENSQIELDIEFVLEASGYAEAYPEGGPVKGDYFSRAELTLFDSQGNELFTQVAGTHGFVDSDNLFSNSFSRNAQTLKNYSLFSDETYTFALRTSAITNADLGDIDIEASAYADPILSFSHGVPVDNQGNSIFSINEALTSGESNFTAVPEPSTLAIMALALIGFCARRKV